MLENYLTIATHPLLWIFIGLTAVFYGVQWVVNPRPDHQHRSFGTTGWLRRHYVAIVFALGGAAIVLALVFYVFEVGIAVARLVDRLRLGAAGDLTETEAKDLAYGIAVLLGAMVAAATIPFTLLRTWINERTATATEEGLITDRINKAVEGLGAEKTKNRMGRTIKYTEIKDQIEREFETFEWQEAPFVTQGKQLTSGPEFGPWTLFTETEPNLEVRIGAIYALERISQDSARDHIQIMEILCAYIRQNAGRGDVPLPEGEPTPEEWRVWAREGQEHPRLDVDVALKVIERRGDKRKQLEKDQHPPYRIGLERALLRKIILSDRDLSQGEFREAELQGANLWSTQLQGANLFGAQLQGAEFRFAQLQGAILVGAQLQGANLRNATLKGASLNYARFEGADLRETTFTGDLGLTTAYFQGAAIGSIDLSSIPEISAHLPGMFADGTVTLPGGHRTEHESWPQHWPKFELDYQQFEIEWRKWQKEGPDYKPPKAE